MPCIFLLRDVFESLICCLDLCLSSLLVAFISMCFSFLWKQFFFKLDSSPTYLFLSSPYSFLSRQILLQSSSIETFSVLLNRSSTTSLIHRGNFAIDRSSTTPQQIHFCWDLVLDRFRQIFRSIELHFLYIAEARIWSHFSHSLSIENLSLSLQTPFLHSNPLTHLHFGLDLALIFW